MTQNQFHKLMNKSTWNVLLISGVSYAGCFAQSGNVGRGDCEGGHQPYTETQEKGWYLSTTIQNRNAEN